MLEHCSRHGFVFLGSVSNGIVPSGLRFSALFWRFFWIPHLGDGTQCVCHAQRIRASSFFQLLFHFQGVVQITVGNLVKKIKN